MFGFEAIFIFVVDALLDYVVEAIVVVAVEKMQAMHFENEKILFVYQGRLFEGVKLLLGKYIFLDNLR